MSEGASYNGFGVEHAPPVVTGRAPTTADINHVVQWTNKSFQRITMPTFPAGYGGPATANPEAFVWRKWTITPSQLAVSGATAEWDLISDDKCRFLVAAAIIVKTPFSGPTAPLELLLWVRDADDAIEFSMQKYVDATNMALPGATVYELSMGSSKWFGRLEIYVAAGAGDNLNEYTAGLAEIHVLMASLPT